MRFPDLRNVLDDFPWALIGAAATRLYMPERATQVLEILVLHSDAAEVRRRLSAAGFQRRGELSIGGRSWATPDGFPIDAVECDEDWCEDALNQSRMNRDPHGAPVLPLPFLVLLKFRAGRAQDLADLTRMLGLAPTEELDAVRRVFAMWHPDDLEDLESLIALGQLETHPPAQ
jgi:hypothetical protein